MTSVCMSSMTSRVDSAPPEPTDTVRHQTVGFVISSYHHHHHLRSSSSSQLVIRRTRLSTVGDRAFPVAGSRLWNSLPLDVTSASTLTVFFFGKASRLISFPDHFLPNCFRFLVLYTVYSSGLAVLYLGHSK